MLVVGCCFGFLELRSSPWVLLRREPLLPQMVCSMRWIRPLAEPWFSVDIESDSIAVDEVQLVTVEVPWARRYEMRSHAVEENFGTVALQVRAWGLEGWTVGAGKSEPKVKLLRPAPDTGLERTGAG